MGRERVFLRVHWRAVIADLQAAGYTLRQLGERVGVDHTALCRCNYGDMRHAAGERLVTLWMQTTGNEREALPLSDGLEYET